MRDQRFIAAHRGGSLTLEHHRFLMDWACQCATHVLPLMDVVPDERLITALKTAEAWVQGQAAVGAAIHASRAAHAVAREAVNPVEIAVARAVGQAVATAHMADHSLGAAWYALRAVKASGQSAEFERNWQLQQLPVEVSELVCSPFGSSKFGSAGSNGKR
ncbi:hypothetical protein GCM10022631_20050 [Deinococcus rubellus]|uniref:putative immunity protein n=1 Tax=Deinococcus rubellus TaxID=1889240 RepID=UPI00337B95AB